ncbi:MAG: hypothetical protein M1821_003250 [Bathelium mastoideum]|nr:MAG: hypothetical protein M1821_003250 [Bathelium mastoideum]KAI9689393.1 MAG: hypothetical protein M1822_010044 [Bathelium mastoideum]
MESEHASRRDRALSRHEAFDLVSLNLSGPDATDFVWETLEQPSMTYFSGKIAGTCTLEHYVSQAGESRPVIRYPSNAEPKKVTMLTILERLRQLETGLDAENPNSLYEHLYHFLIKDPESDDNPHYGVDMQIADLINVLGSASYGWIDFSDPRHQVLAKFVNSKDINRRHDFFHQLVLAIELYLRIHLPNIYSDADRTKLLTQLPLKIAWDLAVAERWLENISTSKASSDRTSPSKSTFVFDLRTKNRQKEALQVFMDIMRWPNKLEVETVLLESNRRATLLEDRSADAWSWFSGLILPGRTLPWLLVNSLIDCDPGASDSLYYLTHMAPSSGFQYRGSTYWSRRCIVGKVLGAARGVDEAAGWIGPCPYSPDLSRIECIRVRQLPALDTPLVPADVASMKVRTSPLGPIDDAYPVNDYELVTPDADEITDAIRIQKLGFRPLREQPSISRSSMLDEHQPLTWDAAIIFACEGETCPMRLRYDVDFITAFPCHEGPHVLFYDYAYRAVKVDHGLANIHNWADRNRARSDSTPTEMPSPARSSSSARPRSPDRSAASVLDEVLVIEALGVSDNEVFARAWCAHWGVSAIVANVKETCMACAIREAYAACVSVVILTECGKESEMERL